MMETEEEKEKKKKKKKSLDGQMEGVSAADVQARDQAKRGLGTAGAQRARAEEATQAAVTREKVQPTVQTVDRQAEAWAKKNRIQFGLGKAPAFYNGVKKKVASGMSLDEAAENTAREMGLRP